MEYREVSAKTVDEAITQACMDMGLASDQLVIDVVSEGSAGFLGIGSKPAVIRVREKTEEDITAEAAEAQAAEKAAEIKAKAMAEPEVEAATQAVEEAKEEVKEEIEKPEPVERTAEEIEAMKSAADGFLKKVFEAMEMPVEITMAYEEEEDVFSLDLAGKDMGVLIGKRGQTLDSLQYLTSLVVNRGQKQFVRVKLDTEDYRRRRKETLENLASNIARKVKKTHKAVSLEAMNPYERRIIHASLQGNDAVETYSEGNEPYRHVVVAPKR